MNNSNNNKRIAKNTLLLYFRMLFLMLISLYTSRVILAALGIEDFGIYNVVGGVVAMFSMITTSLSTAISRFLTFELGTGNKVKLNAIFSTSVTVQSIISILVVLLAETIGVWFLNNKMVIPVHRLESANWVLQFSIFTFLVNLISIPYNAVIIANEKMSAFAYISIVEAIGKLLIAFLIGVFSHDRLIFYAFLMFVFAVIVRLIYGWYCKKHFEECCYSFIWDKTIMKKMFSFSGWNFIGAASSILRDTGGNIALNLFCGPAVNAARGISGQVNGAVNAFVSNFMVALNPQITKSYASKDYGYMMILIFQGAKLSFYMFLFLSLPILINADFILSLWLKEVPIHTVQFVQLILVFTMCESISQPLITAMLATGNIRNYQLIVGGLQMLNLPFSYVLLRMGLFPEIVMIVAIVISQCCLVARLYMLRGMINLKVKDYLKKVYFNVISTTIIAAIIPVSLSFVLKSNIVSFIALSVISLITTLLSVFLLGCNSIERQIIKNKVKTIITK